MSTSLTDYKQDFLEQLLALLWGQWDAIGVQGTTTPEENAVIDPEALILLTASIGRYDARLFDEALNWMQLHERLINVARLQSLLVRESFSGGQALSAMAEYLSAPKSAVKWKQLVKNARRPHVESLSLFFHKDGTPLPVVREPDPVFERAGLLRDRVSHRKMVRIFDPERPVNLLLRLRALFGVNSRAEVVTYLASHAYAGAAETAARIGYLQRTVYNTLVDLNLSGYLEVRIQGGENRYRLIEQAWRPLLGHPLPWRNWGVLFGVLDHIWQKLNTIEVNDAQGLALASDSMLLVRDSVTRLDRGGIATGIRQRPMEDDPEKQIAKSFNDLSRILDMTVE